MTPAEYRAALAALGTSAEVVATITGVHPNSVLRWSHMSRKLDVPERAAEAIHAMLRDREQAVLDLMHDADPKGHVPWHTDLDAFYAVCSTVDGWGVGTQAQVILEVQRRLVMPVEYER